PCAWITNPHRLATPREPPAPDRRLAHGRTRDPNLVPAANRTRYADDEPPQPRPQPMLLPRDSGRLRFAPRGHFPSPRHAPRFLQPRVADNPDTRSRSAVSSSQPS